MYSVLIFFDIHTNVCSAKGIKASYYHAYLDANERNNAHEKWLSGGIDVIVATVAFGLSFPFVNNIYALEFD